MPSRPKPQSVEIQPEGYPPLVNGGRIYTPFWTDGIVARPGALGGANWPPSSYDPVSGYLYVCATDRIGFFKGGDVDNELPEMEGDRYIGGEFGTVPHPVSGILAAMDMRTNTIVWRQQWSELCYSGSTVTASGLLFIGRGDGRLTALDSSTGDLLWEFQTGAGLNAPVSIFEHEGEQYVVAYSAGSRFAGSPRGDSVWVFSLGGTLEETYPAGSEPTVQETEH